ncbi:ribosome-inactivating family protein [Streptomyces sp. ADMS]|uniref:ribosome-inactivating family protein n=1 Tax=Streptomyces sp. ADMS TaxID=3071415 RepID=UPI00296FBC85|nr:ribosome-inactivating family protein [Streptomyces sp. ADMS]MDW4910789.1 ribosome-inactivating family protein [Streptomyces sp. ADMS]
MHSTSDPSPPPRAGSRGHRRGSRWFKGKFLALFLAVATLLGGGALVAPQFQNKASAIDNDKDITWDINGGFSAYEAMVKAVRQRATGGRVLNDGVLQTDPNLDPKKTRGEDGERFPNIFALNLEHSGVAGSSDAPRVRLLMRARDLFVIGFELTTPSGPTSDNLHFFKGDDPGYRGATGEALPNEESYTGSYIDLERVGGRSRFGFELSGPVMEQAFRDLRDQRNQASVARAMMVFIMTVAETARFDPLEQAYRAPFDNGSHTITQSEAELMNSWSEASRQMTNSLNNGAVIDFAVRDSDPNTVDFVAQTLGSLSAILAICIVQNSL